MGLLNVALIAEAQESRAVAAESWIDARGGHGLDKMEGKVGITASCGETDESSEGGLIRSDAIN